MKNYDVVADVGFQVAVEKAFVVSVLDGNLDVDFAHVTDHPFVNAIEVVALQQGTTRSAGAEAGRPAEESRIINDQGSAAFVLRGNYPNPFYSSTTIVLDLPAPAEIIISVFDVLGRQVMSSTPEIMQPGYQRDVELSLDMLPSGAYVYHVTHKGKVGAFVQTGRLIKLR